MKKISISLLCFLLLLLGACKKDFLQVDPGVNLSLDAVFADPLYATQFADNSYNYLGDDYMKIGPQGYNDAFAEFTDEAVEGTGDERHIQAFNFGLFYDATNVSGPWNEGIGVYGRMYSGIRNVNVFLANAGKVPWASAETANRIRGEQYFLRAFFYFELMKRFGGVKIMNKVYAPDDDIDFPRSSYQQTLDTLLADLSRAEALLPADYDAANTGRATLGASRALRARALLYAASERDNPGSTDKTKWQRAAAAAKSVMDMNKYSLHPSYGALMSTATSPEFIMIKIRGPRAFSVGWANYIISNGSGGGYCNFNPSQNHVDLYEMNNGKPISDPMSGYDPNNPYLNRDPRFYSNILYNDATWQGRQMQMWQDTLGQGAGGINRVATDYVPTSVYTTATRYYCRKMWPDVFKTGATQTALLNYFFFRYGEVLLNYAEAQNEAVGPDASVYDAINQIRTRAGMPNLPTGLTQSEMRSRIRNERAVELAFEDNRWFDILRWKAGPQIINGPMFGMDIKLLPGNTFKYRKFQLISKYNRVFLDYMHYYPIPLVELQKSRGALVQNPGWPPL